MVTLGYSASVLCQPLGTLAAQRARGLPATGQLSGALSIFMCLRCVRCLIHELSYYPPLILGLPWPLCLSLCQWSSLAVAMATLSVSRGFGTNKEPADVKCTYERSPRGWEGCVHTRARAHARTHARTHLHTRSPSKERSARLHHKGAHTLVRTVVSTIDRQSAGASFHSNHFDRDGERE